jgi:hypothetical protein
LPVVPVSAIQQALASLRDFLTWWVTVTPWEQAIRVRLGKRVVLLGPGIHVRLPVVDRIYRQSVRRRASSLPAQTLVTRDGRPLTVAVMVGYRINDLLRLYETLHHAEATIANTVLGAVGEFVVTHDSDECGPAALGAAAGASADLERYGIADVSVTVNSFAFVRTYRLITGEGHSWSHGDFLDTSREDSREGGPR